MMASHVGPLDYRDVDGGVIRWFATPTISKPVPATINSNPEPEHRPPVWRWG